MIYILQYYFGSNFLPTNLGLPNKLEAKNERKRAGSGKKLKNQVRQHIAEDDFDLLKRRPDPRRLAAKGLFGSSPYSVPAENVFSQQAF
jgi:hypothetical protein